MNLHIFLPIILLPAKLIEALMRRLGLPAAIGTILVGILLGPALWGVIPSEAGDPVGFEIVRELARIGLCVLLFRIGLETHFKDFFPVWRQTTYIGISGMALSFALGWALTTLWGWSQQTAVFVGATLTATSIGITASVLSELDAERSKEGILILGAAILDDVFGLILLSSLVAVVTPTLSVTGQVVKAIAQAIGFLTVSMFIGPYIVRVAMWLSNWCKGTAVILVLAFSYLLILADAAKALGLDMIIGAYGAGLAFAHYPDRAEVEQSLEPLIELLTPLFFVMLGASMEFSGLNPFSEVGREAWAFASMLFVVAMAGKLFSAVWLPSDQANKWAVGSGMMPRGEVGFVFAQIGLTAELFTPGLFSSVVAVLIATTMLGPILLKVSWKKGHVKWAKELDS